MKPPIWISTAVATLVAVTLPACNLVNPREIKPDLTTQAEVNARLGEPGFVHRNEDGTVTWEYSRQPSGTDCYMITFTKNQVVSRFEQVLNDANYDRVRAGMNKDEVRRLLGAPGSKTIFDNLREEIWEWRIEGMPIMNETYFMVQFDLDRGKVKTTAKRVQPKIDQ